MPAALAPSGRDAPVVKRQRLEVADAPTRKEAESKIFTPFRTIGLVNSTPVPFTAVPYKDKSFFISTSVGRTLQTYDLRGLRLSYITRPQTPEVITATAESKDRTFAAWGGGNGSTAQGLWVFAHGKRLAELEVPEDVNQPIKHILVFGIWIIASRTTRIEVYKRSSGYQHYTTLYTTAAPKRGNDISGGATNMPTFLNKIFVGRKDGGIEIWNVSSGKLVYALMPPAPDCGAVTALQSSPAIGLLAAAYSGGQLAILDVQRDRAVIELNGGLFPITSISFRTDDLGAGEDGRKAGVMATSGPETGDVTFWDLNGGGRVMGILRGAHNPPSDKGATVGGGVTKVEFLPGQPTVVTSGMDNSLKSWTFDETPFSVIPRPLHIRSGHAAPVTKLLFLPSAADDAGDSGKWLLSSGGDRSLWGWSLKMDRLSGELSQGPIGKLARKRGLTATTTGSDRPGTTIDDLKVPEIISMAVCLNRDGGRGGAGGAKETWKKASNQKGPKDATASALTGWESVVTGHRSDRFARTWFWGRRTAGRWVFETGDQGDVSSVAISPDGTFAIIGSQKGGIDMYNLQSGLHQQQYPAKLTPQQAKVLKFKQRQAIESGSTIPTTESNFTKANLGKHKKEITGVTVDSMNKNIISCSLDGKVKFWGLLTGALEAEIDWSPMVAITGLRYLASNDLIALSCNDNSIRIVDIETKKTIRELWGCKGKINDFCFSTDGRWIIAASSDRVIRVWDLPTGHLIDALRTRSECTALSFSPSGDFLATTCEGEVGVDIWNNRTIFTHVPTRHISEEEIHDVSRPSASGEGGHGVIDGAFEDEAEEGEDVAPAASLDQLSSDMMTLSLVPKSRWQNLLSLDLIRQRNKPIEPPKVPEKAPFFLPSLEKPMAIAGIEQQIAIDDVAERSRIMKMDRLGQEGAFTVSLRIGGDSGNYTPFINLLKTLSPSAADLEIRSLNVDEDSDELVNFVEALTNQLKLKRDYELVQAWMAVFLKLHMETVAHDERLIEALREWRECQQAEGARLNELVGYCGGIVGFLRNSRR